MKMKAILAMVLVLLAGVVTPAFSAGFHIREQGIKAMGMGNAFTAQADDPSALFYNPAGIAFQEGTQFSLGTLIINVPETEFTGEVHNLGGVELDDRSVVGEEARKDIFFPPHLYAFKTLDNSPLSFGIATNSLFPLAKRWDTNSPLASRTKEIAIKPLNVQPTVAYRFEDWNLSLAAGIDYTHATVWLEKVQYADAEIMSTQENPIPSGYSAIPVGAIEIEGDGDGWGYNFGALWKPREDFSVGLSYRSEIDLDFDGGDADFITMTGRVVTDASTQITLPEMWSFGIAYKPTPRWTFEADIDRTGWSSYNRLAIDFEDGLPDMDHHKSWEDVWAYRLGAQYGVTDHLDLRLGYAFDETPVPDETLGPELPDSDRANYSAGMGYKDTWGSIDLAYMFVDFKDRYVSNDIQTGTYKSEAHLFGASVTVKF